MGILETICAERKADAARSKRERPVATLERQAGPCRPCFAAAAFASRRGDGRETAADASRAGRDGCLLIAECKRASPSRGLMIHDYDPITLARSYESGGAGMISVLTEPRHFLGSDENLAAVRAAVGVGVLRKDFIVDAYQVAEAWALGADAVLLIAAALSAAQLREFAAASKELGLAALVEVHDESELARAAGAKADAIGVNVRDLRDFSVDAQRARALAGLLPEGAFRVAESGMRRPEDAAALAAAGYRGFLVGEALATSADPESRTREFKAALDGARSGDSA